MKKFSRDIFENTKFNEAKNLKLIILSLYVFI